MKCRLLVFIVELFKFITFIPMMVIILICAIPSYIIFGRYLFDWYGEFITFWKPCEDV